MTLACINMLPSPQASRAARTISRKPRNASPSQSSSRHVHREPVEPSSLAPGSQPFSVDSSNASWYGYFHIPVPSPTDPPSPDCSKTGFMQHASAAFSTALERSVGEEPWTQEVIGSKPRAPVMASPLVNREPSNVWSNTTWFILLLIWQKGLVTYTWAWLKVRAVGDPSPDVFVCPRFEPMNFLGVKPRLSRVSCGERQTERNSAASEPKTILSAELLCLVRLF